MRANKYRAQKCEADGYKFDSLKERTRYLELKLLERSGHIIELEVHPRFKFEINGKPLLLRSEGYPNGRQASYTPDFSYTEINKKPDGSSTATLVVEDVKSKATKTEAYALRKGLMEAIYGIVIKEI